MLDAKGADTGERVYFLGYCIVVDTGERDGTARVSKDKDAPQRHAFEVSLDRLRPATPADKKRVRTNYEQISMFPETGS